LEKLAEYGLLKDLEASLPLRQTLIRVLTTKMSSIIPCFPFFLAS